MKIKTIPGGHLVIIIRQFIGPVASWFPVTKVPSTGTRESTLKIKNRTTFVTLTLKINVKRKPLKKYLIG